MPLSLRRCPAFLLVLAVLGFLVLSAGAQQPETGLQYDLRPGDHLIYRQKLVREIDNSNRLKQKDARGRQLYVRRDSRIEAEWENHVLVLAEERGGFLVGIQRNLRRAEIIRFRVAGKELRDERQPGFQQRVFSSPSFSEATVVDRSGVARHSWSAKREWNSKVLFDVHEILPLPTGALSRGQKWTVEGFRRYEYEVKGREDLGEEPCLAAEGRSSANTAASVNSIGIGYLFCPDRGLLAKAVLHSQYLNALFAKVSDTVELELVERRRGEIVEKWLADPELRLAVLDAALTGDRFHLEPESLYALLQDAEPAVQTRVLALSYRQDLPPPASDVMVRLLDSEDARVRALAARVLSQAHGAAPGPLLDRIRKAPDYFVREAAAVPNAESASPKEVVAEPGHARPGVYSARFPLEGGGTWPGIVQVPLEYRGDAPFPLVIYLAGNGGPAVEGMLIGAPAFSRTGYLVVYPEADGRWWDDAPVERLEGLLSEILKRYNVDTNRIYLTGLSNGGTGTLFYAAIWPHQFAAAVSAMGAGLALLDGTGPRKLFPENLTNLPMLFLHGEKDRTIAPRISREIVRRLKQSRAPVEEHYFKELGHGVVVGRGDEGRTIDFLQRFVRNPFPRRLHFKMDALRFPRHYWIEVLEKKRGVLTVQAEISEGNTVEIKTRRVGRLRLLLRPELFSRDGPIRVILNGKVVFAGPLLADAEVLARSLEQTRDPGLAYSTELTLDVP